MAEGNPASIDLTLPDQQEKGSINFLLNEGDSTQSAASSSSPSSSKGRRSKPRPLRRKAGSVIVPRTTPAPTVRGRKSGSWVKQSRRRKEGMEEEDVVALEDGEMRVPNLPPISSLLPQCTTSPRSFSFSPISSPCSSPRNPSSPRMTVSWSPVDSSPRATTSSPLSFTSDSVSGWSHDPGTRSRSDQDESSESMEGYTYYEQQRPIMPPPWPVGQGYERSIANKQQNANEREADQGQMSNHETRAARPKSGHPSGLSPAAMMSAFGQGAFSTSSPSLLPPRHLHGAPVTYFVPQPVPVQSSVHQPQQQQYDVPNNTTTSCSSVHQSYRQPPPLQYYQSVLSHNNPPPPPQLNGSPGRQPAQVAAQPAPYSHQQYYRPHPSPSPAILASFGQSQISLSAPSLLPSMVASSMPPPSFPPSLRGDKIHPRWATSDGRATGSPSAPIASKPIGNGAASLSPAHSQAGSNDDQHDGQGSTKRAKRGGRGGSGGGSDFTFLHLQVSNDGRLTMVKELN